MYQGSTAGSKRSGLDGERPILYKMHVRHPLQASLVLLAVLLALADAWADKGVGVAAGVALPLAPLDQPGVAGGLSTVLTDFESERVPGGLLHLRGEVQGIWSPDAGIGAVMPQLTADLGLELGRVELFLSGGLQIFGVTWREGYTFFTTLGLVGGGGLQLRLHARISLELRAVVSWLPSFAAASMEQPDPAPGRPTLLFLTGLAGVVLRL